MKQSKFWLKHNFIFENRLGPTFWRKDRGIRYSDYILIQNQKIETKKYDKVLSDHSLLVAIISIISEKIK